MATLSDDEYERLKKFMGLFYDWFQAKPNHPPEIHPLVVAKGFEQKSCAQAKRGLAMAINDILEMSSDWSPEHVAAADKRFLEHGAPTLSELRSKYSKKYVQLLKRGSIRTEVEYYFLKGIVDGDSIERGAGEREHIDAMLAAYETKVRQ
jgi:hypothetical protein